MNNTTFTLNLMIGNDNGNSEQDIIIEGEQICQPNVLSKIRKLPLLDEVNSEYVVKNIHDNLLVTVNSPGIVPALYYVGSSALKSGQRVKNIEVGVDNNKVDSELVIINTLAHIAGYAVKKAYIVNEKFIDNIRVTVDMATALPISQYNKSNAMKFTSKFLEGKHEVIVYLGELRSNVEINFDFAKVIPEGVTATWALQNASEQVFIEHNSKYPTKLNSQYFKEKNVLHVAIGEGTTEFPITKGIIFDPNFIKGTNNGIGHAIDKSLDEFKNELGLTSYSRQKYSEVLRDPSHKYYDIAEDIIQDYIEEQAEEILHHAKAEIQRANNEIDIIVCYGGGSILMRNHLEKKLLKYCERAKIELFYVPKSYAVTLESKGLYEFVKSDIFKKLKNKNRNRN